MLAASTYLPVGKREEKYLRGCLCIHVSGIAAVMYLG